jgi:hypothetical protein
MRDRNAGAKEYLVLFLVRDVEGTEIVRISTRLDKLLSSTNSRLFPLLSMEGVAGQGSGQRTIKEIPSNSQDEE